MENTESSLKVFYQTPEFLEVDKTLSAQIDAYIANIKPNSRKMFTIEEIIEVVQELQEDYHITHTERCAYQAVINKFKELYQ